LIAGRGIAETSPDTDGCTLDAGWYSFTIPGVPALHIFDTVGLQEPEIGTITSTGAIAKAHKLVETLKKAGGIDLLLFCVRGKRITAALKQTYQLFLVALCGGQVPLAIVVTNLEKEKVMEDWWGRNEEAIRKYEIRSVAHVCITAVPADEEMFVQKREESQRALRKMLLEVLVRSPKASYVEEGTYNCASGEIPGSITNHYFFLLVIPGGRNVVLFGETGAGKSSVINLIAGREIATTSPDTEGCTLDAERYSFTIPGAPALNIFDTVGLQEPELGINTFMGAIAKAHKLVETLKKAGGIDLLLFCVRGGRMTVALKQTYRLFFGALCGGRVPLAIVVTNLELEKVMEDWWGRNEETFQKYEIRPVAHACITAVPADVTMFAQKREESQQVLLKMLLEVLRSPKASYVEEEHNWFRAIVQQLWSFSARRGPAILKRIIIERDISRVLETECGMTRSEAQRLAQ
ncbi:hypothetical protein OG21DRAFT_1386738, partial [Imleria badia]